LGQLSAAETKQYVKKVLGVNVDGQPDAGVSANIKSISESLGIPLYDGTPGKPTSGEQTQVNLGTELSAGPNPDTKPILDAAGKASTSSERYSTFLNGAIQPIVQNMAAQTAGMQRIATVKTGLANDFRTRETDLESKIQPLLAKRQQISDQIAALDQLSPLDRRLKSIFNPMRYDPRMLRGQLERVEGQISTLDSNYKELNNLRSGVAAASVDAETADIGTLEAGRQSTIAEATLLGQVAGATKEQSQRHSFRCRLLLKLRVCKNTSALQLLGRLTSEETHALFNEAQGRARRNCYRSGNEVHRRRFAECRSSESTG
jgi:hypothetical protein